MDAFGLDHTHLRPPCVSFYMGNSMDDDEEVVEPIVIEALNRYKHLQDNIVYKDDDITVSIVDNTLIVREDGTLRVFILFAKSHLQAKELSKSIVELYKTLGFANVSFYYLFFSMCRRVTTHHYPLTTFYIYEM